MFCFNLRFFFILAINSSPFHLKIFLRLWCVVSKLLHAGCCVFWAFLTHFMNPLHSCRSFSSILIQLIFISVFHSAFFCIFVVCFLTIYLPHLSFSTKLPLSTKSWAVLIFFWEFANPSHWFFILFMIILMIILNGLSFSFCSFYRSSKFTHIIILLSLFYHSLLFMVLMLCSLWQLYLQFAGPLLR